MPIGLSFEKAKITFLILFIHASFGSPTSSSYELPNAIGSVLRASKRKSLNSFHLLSGSFFTITIAKMAQKIVLFLFYLLAGCFLPARSAQGPCRLDE